MKDFFQIAECSFILCKDNTNERNERFFSDCRVQFIVCKFTIKFPNYKPVEIKNRNEYLRVLAA